MTFANTLDHFKTQHPHNIIYDIGTELTLYEFDLVDGYGDVNLIVLGSNLFVYHVDIDLDKKLALWAVQFVGVSNEACRWHFRIVVSDKTGFYSLNASARCSAMFRNSSRMYNSGHCVGVPLNILKNFVREDKNVHFRLHIEPNATA